MSAKETPGYKMTEVGVIPEDWSTSPLGDMLTGHPKYGINAPAVSYDDSLPKYIRITDISENGDFQNNSPVSVVHSQASLYFLCDGDIVLARTGASVGKSYKYKESDGPLVYAGFLIKIHPDQSRLNPDFCAAYFNSAQYWNWVKVNSMRSGQPGINGKEYAGIKIPIPSLEEQGRIASALSEIDALTSSLDKLISKKRDIKQAAMQQLLTGQKRLPGFSGDWEAKRLGDIAHIKTGSKNNQDKVEDGEYPFYVRSATVERINSYSHDCEAILIPGEGGVGSIFHYINGRFDVHQRVYAITQFADDVSGKYIHLYMSVRFGAHAMQNSVKATVDSLRLPTFQVFEVLLPPTKEEQTAIATILSEMDAELATLEARRDKARQLKQGMMQELLTGRIRLV